MSRRNLPAIAILSAVAALAQTPQKPVYDVAAIKPNNSGSGSSSTNGNKTQIVFVNQSLHRYIERAWSVKPIQVVAPDWLSNTYFDITAKFPENSKPDDRWLMLQSLLEDRFKLSIHHETKEMSGYALVLAKGGLKIQPVESAGGSGTSTNGDRILTLKATTMSMASIADFLGRQLGTAVVDKTGASGVYTFQLRWLSNDQSPDTANTDAPSLFTAIQETLGLRLQPEKVPVDMIVVDHIEHDPTEN